jgi:hypothetical protein
VGASYTDAAKTEIAHLPAATTGLRLKIGEPVHAAIDWDLRCIKLGGSVAAAAAKVSSWH